MEGRHCHRSQPAGEKVRHQNRHGLFRGEAVCPRGVLCRPHSDEYRRISAEMFHVLEQYLPTLVPISIDEGFLDFTTMDSVVWRDTTPEKYVREICDRIAREVKIPVSAGLANSSRLAKLATDAAKPGFHRNQTRRGKGISERPLRARAFRHRQEPPSCVAALGAMTFGHVAKLPSPWPKKKFAIWGIAEGFANGLWNEPLLEIVVPDPSLRAAAARSTDRSQTARAAFPRCRISPEQWRRQFRDVAKCHRAERGQRALAVLADARKVRARSGLSEIPFPRRA